MKGTICTTPYGAVANTNYTISTYVSRFSIPASTLCSIYSPRIFQNDPYELTNIFPSADQRDEKGPSRFLGRSLSQVIDRLDALLLVVKSCKGAECVQPWKALHPSGDVDSLRDALSLRFDAFYHQQAKVSFDRCEPGYILDAEGPQFQRDGFSWSDWA